MYTRNATHAAAMYQGMVVKSKNQLYVWQSVRGEGEKKENERGEERE